MNIKSENIKYNIEKFNNNNFFVLWYRRKLDLLSHKKFPELFMVKRRSLRP